MLLFKASDHAAAAKARKAPVLKAAAIFSFGIISFLLIPLRKSRPFAHRSTPEDHADDNGRIAVNIL